MGRNFTSEPVSQYNAQVLGIQGAQPRFINRLNSAMAVRQEEMCNMSRNEGIAMGLDDNKQFNRPQTSYVRFQ